MKADYPIDELLEAFRPGIDNLAEETWEKLRAPLADDPELQQRSQALRESDDAVRMAMHDVPIPAGLAERLLASLPGPQPKELPTTAPPACEPALVELPSRVAETPMSRRTWWMAFTSLASVALVLAIVFAWNAWPLEPGNVSAEQLVEMIESWEGDAAFRESARWQQLPDHQPLRSYAVPAEDLAATLQRATGPVRRVGLLVAAYEISSGRGQTARLYVAHTGKTFAVPQTPATILPPLTGSRAAAAWQRGAYLYVVVYDPREARPDDFVRVRNFT